MRSARSGLGNPVPGGVVRGWRILLLIFALVLVTAAPAGANFAGRQLLHGGDRAADWPVVAMNGNTVHAFWTEWDLGNGNAIYYARSANAGRTWTNARRISPFSVWMRRPDVAVSGNDIHVVFESDHRTPGIGEAFYRRSRDGGATWDRIRMLSQNDGSRSTSPSVGAEGKLVSVGWADIRYFGDPIPAATVTRFSVDRGTRFRPQHSAFAGFDIGPHIAVLNGVVHMVFANSQAVWYQRSGNGGKRWTGPRLISPASLSSTGRMDLEAGNGSVHVVFGTSDWNAGLGRIQEKVFYRRLNYRNQRWSWSSRRQMTSYGTDPMVNAGGGEVAVVWLRYRLVNDGTNQSIYLRTSGTGGWTWRRAERVAAYGSSSCHTTHAGVATMGHAVVVWNKIRDCRSRAYAVRDV